MNRRDFIKSFGAAVAALAVSGPAIAQTGFKAVADYSKGSVFEGALGSFDASRRYGNTIAVHGVNPDLKYWADFVLRDARKNVRSGHQVSLICKEMDYGHVHLVSWLYDPKGWLPDSAALIAKVVL